MSRLHPTIALAVLFQISAHAGMFPACATPRFTPRFDLPSPRRCETFRAALDRLSPIMKHEAQQHDVDQAGALLAGEVGAILDRGIKARSKLLSCLGGDAEAGCDKRIQTLRASIERHLRTYRAMLALAGQPNSPAAAVDALDPNLRALPLLGGRPLPPLTSAEYWRLRRLREQFVNAADTFEGHDLSAAALPKNEFIARCQRRPDEPACVEYKGFKENVKIRLRTSASRLALSTVAELPIITQFDQLPITDDDLRRALRKTNSALKDWRDQITKAPDYDALLVDYPNLADELLGDHPEWCASLERRVLHARSVGWIKKYSLEGVGIAAAAGVCLYSMGVACAAANIALNGVEAVAARGRYDQALGQFEAGENDRLVRTKNLRESHDDFIASLAFTGVQSLPITFTAKLATKSYITAEEGGDYLRVLADYRDDERRGDDLKLAKAFDAAEIP